MLLKKAIPRASPHNALIYKIMENYSEYPQLEDEALRVWNKNDRGEYMAPNGKNYPHAWLWDSAFHSIGMRHYDIDRAAIELYSIFDGQWENGMLPNIRMYHPVGDARAEKHMWSSHLLNNDAPKYPATSGISQPPVVAEAMYSVGQQMSPEVRNDFWQSLLPSLIKYHEWIYRDRNPRADGLFAAVHPWETGMDNSPAVMEYSRGLAWCSEWALKPLAGLSQHFRRDLHNHLPANERSSHEEGELQAMALLSLIRCRYDAKKLKSHHSFHLQDVGTNSLLIRNNYLLQQMAKQSGMSIPNSLNNNIRTTQESLDYLWNEDDQMYYSRCAVTGQQIMVPTFASMLPLLTGQVESEREKVLIEKLTDPEKYWSQYGIANVPLDYEGRRDNGYWHEVWMNTNWLGHKMLQSVGRHEEAELLRARSLEVVDKNGIYEYFNARTGKGLGVKDFGWTAMLALDLLHETGYNKT